ncbi:hypothetical protein ABC795_16575 [Blastococcus sp. HT6-30]
MEKHEQNPRNTHESPATSRDESTVESTARAVARLLANPRRTRRD